MIPEAPMPPPAGLWAALPIAGLVIDEVGVTVAAVELGSKNIS